MEIPYDYYRIFYYVATYKNITQAANMLLSNQPNVTRTIKNLEAALGCSLFLRTNRGVTLTPEGKKLYARVSIAFEQIELAQQELAMEQSMEHGTVSIGATEIALHTILLPVLKSFHTKYPGIKLHLSNDTTLQAIRALHERRIDFAIVTTPVDPAKNITSIPLRQIQEVPVCGQQYQHLAGRTLSLKELNQYPIICMNKQTVTFSMYSAWFAQQKQTLSPAIEAATADQILPMVRNDLGIGFVPEVFLVGEDESTGIIRLSLNTPVPRRAVCLVKHRDVPMSIAAKALENMLTMDADK